MSRVIEKFLKYVKFDTMSDEESTTVPSTSKQLILAEELARELKEMGLQDVSVDKNGYVMATLPANIDKKVAVIGFIAHMDTSSELSGEHVNPKIIKSYDGSDIVLNEEQNIVLRISESPELKDYIGQDIITTDGITLLGADDKAGIAEIMSAVEYLTMHPEIKHGDIRVGFTPDEEIGRGADHFDVKKFNADLAYTVDGGVIGELEYENFNAAGAKVAIKGKSFHPGYSKNKMINSALVANEFMSMLPSNETPATTEGYEGFYHLLSINGGVEETNLSYIIRDFDAEKFEGRKVFLQNVVNKLNEKYGNGTVNIEIKDQYRNMKEKVEPEKYVVDIAFKAMEAVGVKPLVRPIRGGTDGSRLSFMGLPTPNLFTGGHNFHGRFEYISIQSMEKAVEVIVKIAELYSEREK
ncbi:peptidase T [Clostridium magnum]|uniref:Peptidase T n=1 Tax=Clostridium magnum DSM 2767 TaxID=1121326 RepID=A0A162S731_9CLOT|nr:peptidase T [Clostridium magnum]KZL90861.1 peptidase T [Clostridium magnum DSM 2767]SHI12324.1 tripeptide aminopeptidase [Clostridium magnum DSM 2767]